MWHTFISLTYPRNFDIPIIWRENFKSPYSIRLTKLKESAFLGCVLVFAIACVI